MAIAVERALAPELQDAAWAFYVRAFEELRTTAVQRHMMHRHEFDEVMADGLVWKYRGIDPDDPTAVPALATFTNALDTMPLISPDYFAHRWPTLYSGRRIWYIGFFGIDPGHRGSGFFEEVIAHMWRIVLDSDGIAVLDICRRNAELGLPTAIHATLASLTVGARATTIDEQTYWLYEPPARS
jgi:hypothetical protein